MHNVSVGWRCRLDTDKVYLRSLTENLKPQFLALMYSQKSFVRDIKQFWEKIHDEPGVKNCKLFEGFSPSSCNLARRIMNPKMACGGSKIRLFARLSTFNVRRSFIAYLQQSIRSKNNLSPMAAIILSAFCIAAGMAGFATFFKCDRLSTIRATISLQGVSELSSTFI